RPMRIFLKRQEISLSKTTVHKYMNQILGLHAMIMRKKPTYVHGIKNKIFPNLLKQKFHCPKPNRIWCTDFTYIRMGNGKMRYNCSILDLYDRSVVASLNSDYINTELAKATLEKALMEEKPEKGLILHSDQGCQFTSWDFINYCESKGICQSMSKAFAENAVILL
ncbi:DDE-type integrase/transposase/recombinase, partial [Blautia hansenii]|uniref:DDE-type integrase/transposase/recombinase n=1 Tax=Blautia hansenii TaxID=1322 RepID=UPI0032C0468A